MSALRLNIFTETSHELDNKETVVFALWECEKALFSCPKEMKIEFLDLIAKGREKLLEGDSFFKAKESVKAKAAYKEAIAYNTAAIIQIDLDYALNPTAVCDLGICFYNRGLVRHRIGLLEKALCDMEISEWILNEHLEFCNGKTDLDDVSAELKSNLTACESTKKELIKELATEAANKIEKVIEKKSDKSTSSKKKKKRKKTQAAVSPKLESKSEVKPPQKSKEQIAKEKLAIKVQEDALRKKIKKQKLAESKKHQEEIVQNHKIKFSNVLTELPAGIQQLEKKKTTKLHLQNLRALMQDDLLNNLLNQLIEEETPAIVQKTITELSPPSPTVVAEKKAELIIEAKLPEFSPYIVPENAETKNTINKIVIQQIKKLKKNELPIVFAVGGVVRDLLLGRSYAQSYKDKFEGDIDTIVPPVEFEKITRAFPKAIRRNLNKLNQFSHSELFLYDIHEENIYKNPAFDTFDETQILESVYLQKKPDGTFLFADPVRAEMLSRDLEINGGLMDEEGNVYATSETRHALQNKLISIPNKLELFKMEAQVFDKKFEEKRFENKTNEQIAFESDIRIFLRAILSRSYDDLSFANEFIKSIPSGINILKNLFDLNNIIVFKQINTLLEKKLFRHQFIMASKRFSLFTEHGINGILFPGLIEAVKQHNLQEQLNQILKTEFMLERVYIGFIVLQYANEIRTLSQQQQNDKEFLLSFILKKIEKSPLIAICLDSYNKFTPAGKPCLFELVSSFINQFNLVSVPIAFAGPLLFQPRKPIVHFQQRMHLGHKGY